MSDNAKVSPDGVTPPKVKEMDALGLPLQPQANPWDNVSPSPNKKSENQVKEIVDAIQDKVKDFNPNYDPESEFDTIEAIGWFEMCSRYMDCTDQVRRGSGLFAALLFGASLPAFCLLFGDMIDSVGESGSSASDDESSGYESLQTQAKYMILIGVGVHFFAWFQISSLAIFSESISFKIKVDYFKKCLEKDAAYYDVQNPAEMASKISKECSAIRRGTGDKTGNIVMSVGGFFLGFAFAFYWGWLLTLIFLATIPVMILSGVGMAMSMEGGEDALKAYAQSAGYAEQALQGIKVVHTYGQELLEKRNYGRYLDKSTKAQQTTTFGMAMGQGMMFLIMFLFYAYAFYWGGRLRYEGIKNGDREYTGGSILAIMFSVVFGAMQVGGMMPHMKAVSDSKIAGKLAFDVIDHVPKIPVNSPESQQVSRDTIKGQIEFKDVSFKYPTRQELQVLNKFSFTFEAGKTTALVGPSGSGKSTVIQLMERFYDPDSGSVLLDGQDFKTLNLRSMRQLIGYVGQEPVLFNTTIKENMLFAKPTASDDEIEKALMDANAWDFISEFPDGINTQVGGAGGQLSGGQKQRVAIARAFLKQPKILLLDEATSALDKLNEAAVQEAIDKYRQRTGDITIIVIAHRLSTIKDADTICVLKNGELVEVGNHEHLLETYPDGVYSSFCQKQASAEAQNQTAVYDSPSKLTETEKGKKTLTKDPVEEKMLKQADEADGERQKEIDAVMEKHAETTPFKKLLPYNKPVCFIIAAIIASANNGSAMPLFGIFFAKMLALLSVPLPAFDIMYPDQPDYLKLEIHKFCLYMTIVACASGIGSFVQRYMFGSLGNRVTHQIRDILYAKILEKNIGWFDHRDNGPSVITSTMAKDTSLVNGVSTESIGPIVEGICALSAGLAFGFYFCWQESIVCLLVSPVMIIGNYLGMEFEKGLADNSAELEKEANLLCGDAIINFKTVQSFGNEEQLLEAYKKMVTPILTLQKKTHIKVGFAFGISQFAQYAVFAAMFYFGGLILKMDAESDSEKKLDPADVFIALFAIMFGASQAGTAASMGPEMGKATSAAAAIFKIIEYPSEINAIAIDEDTSAKKILNTDDIKGKIEFRNVWFRYPTRKQDFVLKGLQLTINPGEQVALVGESGCGKSTFINLLMRFYDPDFGEVLLDDVNIKEYNLHDLRKGISLVMQEPIIFNYSILENILYGKLDAKNSEILDATNLANATEFIEGNNGFQLDDNIMNLKAEMEKNKDLIVDMIGEEKYKEELEVMKKLVEQEGAKGVFQAIEGDVDDRKLSNPSLLDVELHTGFEIQCGSKGSKLSGGQKQRVAIARTIIRKPKVLLLDEATSALDEDSQKKVQQALENIMKGRTTIIIAHRMSTIENCDKIFVLESGTLKEEGNFEELKAQGGYLSKKA